jgi:hypothetical protein
VRLLAFALAFALSGCVAAPAGSPSLPQADASLADLVDALRAAPAPALDGAANLAWLAKFVDAHHPRITGTPGEKAAGDDLAAQLKALGYAVEEHKYNTRGLPSVDGPMRAVVGVKKGASEPDRLILVGGHYDTAPIGRSLVAPLPVGPPPSEAAYDNGSGTSMVLELARLLAQVRTERTIQFVLFNGEEELPASAAYAQELATKHAMVDAYLGFDMVGINWPSTAGCLCIYAGEKFAAQLNPIQEAVVRDVLDYPRANGSVEIYDNHKTRSSDEASFQGVGFPTMRWAGMRLAADYWAYHKLNDTMETMEKQAGGKEPLAKGFEAVAASAYYTILAMDLTRTSP